MPTKKPSPSGKKSAKSSGGLLGYLQSKGKAKIDKIRKENDRAKAKRIDEAVHGTTPARRKPR